MSATHTYLAAGAVALTLNAIAGAILPVASDFMIVHGVTYSDGYIAIDRTIVKAGVADWQVTVVSDDGTSPTCNTVHGSNLHEGWSDYEVSDRDQRTMTLDEWVNDPGCLERLQEKPGDYTQYVTWSPRDGRDPVRFVGPIVIE